MDLRVLERVVAEQKEELELFLNRNMCARLEESFIEAESELAQVVIGVRRSGKSTLCLSRLLSSGRPFGYVNFDDERLDACRGGDLDQVLSAVYSVYGAVDTLFFDEIQNIKEWPLFVNRLLRAGKRLLLTGSNAKLLSSELATHLTGRAHEITLYPFSFRDACVWAKLPLKIHTTQEQGLLRRAWERYLMHGGFPQVVRESVPEHEFLSSLFKNILDRDIVQRYEVRQKEEFRNLAAHLFNVVPTVLNVTSTAHRLDDVIAPNTVRKYVGYLKQAYLLVGIHKYSTKSHLRVRNEKIYPIDVGLFNNRPDAFAQESRGWRLETIVLMELLRRRQHSRADIYYYAEGRTEIDFLVCQDSRPISAVQVAYDLSREKTRHRELAAFERFLEKVDCPDLWLITDTESSDVKLSSGQIVKIRPAYEWLVNDLS